MRRTLPRFPRPKIRWIVPLACLLASTFCSPAATVPAGPVTITGLSRTLTVNGQYASVVIDRVDRLSLANGTLVLHGSSSDVIVALPPGTGQPKPGGQWALVTEGKADGKRTLTFTHEQSLDDFTIELPASDAELRYGTVSGAAGSDVLVFAWGKDSRAGWGFVTITRAGVGPPP